VLTELFPDDLPLRATERGLWLPTPLPLLLAAFDALLDSGWLGPGRASRLLDAGAGDGRVIGAFGQRAAGRLPLELLGIECDPALVACAVRNLEALRATGPLPGGYALVEGDYLAAAAYARLGVAPSEIDLVINYPDGNEEALERWLASHRGARTRLILLGPDRSLAFRTLALAWSTRLEAPNGTAWSLIVSEPVAAARRSPA